MKEIPKYVMNYKKYFNIIIYRIKLIIYKYDTCNNFSYWKSEIFT